MKSRLLLICSVLPLLLALLSACGFNLLQGSGNIESESREVSDFTAIDFSGIGEMTIVQGETESLTIETDDNLLPYIDSTVRNGTLILDVDGDGWIPDILRPTDSIRYMLTVKTLDAIDLSGAGTIDAEALTADSLLLSESGAGTITIEQLTADEVTVSMSGAGMVELAGEVTSQSVDMSGLGTYEAGDLQSQEATISLSGAGSATVWVEEQLDADLSGAGSVSYYGSPQTDSDISGIGNVESLGEK